jgi:hypothetical protein
LSVSYLDALLTPYTLSWLCCSSGTRCVGSGTGSAWTACWRIFLRRPVAFLRRPASEWPLAMGMYRFASFSGHVVLLPQQTVVVMCAVLVVLYLNLVCLWLYLYSGAKAYFEEENRRHHLPVHPPLQPPLPSSSPAPAPSPCNNLTSSHLRPSL